MKKQLRITLSAALAAVLVFSAAQLIRYGLAYKKADDIYAGSRAQYVKTPAETSMPESETDGYPAFTVDLAGLRQKNPDVTGWLYIPETNISYPLVRGSDNGRYLRRSYDLQATASGSIFMDCRNDPGLTDSNTVLYGHNMKNGSMFGGLKKYGGTDYLRAHRDIYIYVPGRVLRYRAFAAYKTVDTSRSYTLELGDDAGFAGFLQFIEKSAAGNETDPPSAAAPLLTLSTCTSTTETGRFVVHAVLVGDKKC